MRYLVYDTEQAAQTDVVNIDTVARAVFAAQGYSIREDGAVIGKRDGEDDPAGVTTTWDVPRQRMDGKWVVAHPEGHPSAAFQTPSGTVLELVMAGITAPAETGAPEWWPLPE